MQKTANQNNQEIPPREVFLLVKYLEDTAKATAYLKQSSSDKSGISAMESSNCFNCHAVHNQLIGPSFKEISQKYPHTVSNEELLAERIIKGSKGIWGSVVMPTHTELTQEAAQQMVNWIMNNAADPGLNVYIGLSGTFKMRQPDASSGKGLLLLTASYTDHGLKNIPNQNLKGRDVTIIQVK